MKPFRSRRQWIAVALVVGALALIGAVLHGKGTGAPTGSADGGRITMPNVVMKDLDRTGRQLVDMGLKVRVRRLPSQFTLSGASRPFNLAEVSKPFKAGEWLHLIADQIPRSGELVALGDEVTLVVGTHHGAGPFLPWIKTHGSVVSIRGDARCGACHAAAYCSECHDRWRRN